MSDRRRRETPAGEFVAPGDHVCARDGAKFLRQFNAGEPDEVLQGRLVGTAGRAVAKVREPLELGGYVGEALEVGGRQQAASPDGERERGWLNITMLLY